MCSLTNGWFTQRNLLWPGQFLSVDVAKEIFYSDCTFKEAQIMDTKRYGRVLALDTVIVSAEKNNCAYHEPTAFLAMCAHPDPRRVLIIGWAMGGVAKEVLKHPSIEAITMVEMDDRLVAACRKYMPEMAKALNHPKVKFHSTEEDLYPLDITEKFDVIITENSNPFIESDYSDKLKRYLNPGGVVLHQGGMAWEEPHYVRRILDEFRQHFPVVRFAYSCIPTFASGQMGYVMLALDPENDVSVPKLEFTPTQLKEMDVSYYNAGIHKIAFVLPTFIKQKLYD